MSGGQLQPINRNLRAAMFFTIILVSIAVRLITLPFRYGYRHRRFYGYDPYYNPYRYGCRRHHGLLGGVLPIIALVALDRIFNRRYW
jgi:asparagine N-glycosylation enzyme membrane subunit Stt3